MTYSSSSNAGAEPITVLDVSEYFGESSGGVRTYLLEKSKHAVRRSVRHVVVTPGKADCISERDGARWYQVRGPAVPFRSDYRFLLATRTLGKIIRNESPDLIEIGSSYFAPWVAHLARRRQQVPMVWFYHSHLPRLALPGPLGRSAPGRALIGGIARYVRHVGGRMDATLAASEYSASELEALGVERVHRVTLGVDTELFHPVRRTARDDVVQQLGIAGGPLVGYVGRMAEEKRVIDLITAWPRIEARTGATLVLVGHGAAEAKIREMSAGLRVKIVPFMRDRERLAELMASLDLYLAAAPFETFGLAACEALASGTPVVAVDHGAVAELVQGSGGGTTVPVGDCIALADAAIRHLQSGRDDSGRRARDFVVRRHSWPVAMDRLFEVYRSLRLM